MDLKQTISRNKELAIIITAYTILQAVILTLVWGKPLTWDPAVYSAMAKHIYTLGEIGFWEEFRPPIIPVILGIAYFIDNSMLGYPRLIMTMISVIGIAVIYYISRKEFGKEIALYASAIIASAQMYFFQSTRINAELTGAILVIASIYFINKSNFKSGIITSIAFLARFPSAIIGLSSSLAVTKIELDKKAYKKMIKENLNLIAGFAILTTIYFYLNHRFFGSFIEPIRTAIIVPAANPEVFLYGVYYLREIIFTQPLLALAPLGLIIVYKHKDLTKHTPYILALTGLYISHEYFPHKEPRYALMFLPLAAIYSGFAIQKIRQKAQNTFEISEKHFYILISVIIAIALLNSFYTTYNLNNWEAPEERQFIQDVQNLEADLVVGNHPYIGAHGQFKYQNLPTGYIDQVYEDRKPELDYIAFNNCAWDIHSEEAREEVEQFENYVEDEYSLHSQQSDDRCTYSIYQVK